MLGAIAPALRGGDSWLAPALRGVDSWLAPALRGGAMSVLSCCTVVACGSEPADLSTEQLSQVVAAQQPTLKVCYDQELERTPTAHELRLDATLNIAPSGRVSGIEIAPGDASSALLSCLRAAIARWQFPRAKDPTQTSLPLIFKPEVVPSGPNLDDVQQWIQQLKTKPGTPPPQAPAQPRPQPPG